jgi:hypothetical protein
MAESTDFVKPYPPNAGLDLRGRDLDPQRINEILGINAHRSFRRGDHKPGGNTKWPHGFWMFWSSEQVESPDIMEHIKWLLDQLEPARPQLIELLQDETIDAEISCFWVMPTTHEEIVLEPELLKRLAQFNVRLELGVYAPSE